MSYPYKPHQILDFLGQPKRLPEDFSVDARRSGKIGKVLIAEGRPRLIDGSFIDMRYIVKAPIPNDVTSYDASFLIADRRVRGVGYDPIGRPNFRFKRRIPKGWHQNVCDPNLPTNDPGQNIHKQLPDFEGNDFRDFIVWTTELWKIELGGEWEGGLL